MKSKDDILVMHTANILHMPPILAFLIQIFAYIKKTEIEKNKKEKKKKQYIYIV